MTKVKVFQKKVKIQGHKVINDSTMQKVLTQAKHICKMKALYFLT